MGNNSPKIVYDKSYKIVAWGDQRVGKTSLFERYIKEKIPKSYHPTGGHLIFKKDINVDGKNVNLTFFDFTGNIFYRGMVILNSTRTDLFMFVYNIIDKATFLSLKTFIPAFKQKFEEKDAIKILIGNKIDLYNKREVTREEAELLAKEHQMIFIETSAMTGEGINDLFNVVVEKLTARFRDEMIKQQNMSPALQPSVPIDYSQQNKNINVTPQMQVNPQLNSQMNVKPQNNINTINNNINYLNIPNNMNDPNNMNYSNNKNNQNNMNLGNDFQKLYNEEKLKNQNLEKKIAELEVINQNLEKELKLEKEKNVQTVNNPNETDEKEKNKILQL